jgi:hypothetical protein
MEKYQIATPGGFEIEVSASSPEAAIKIAEQTWQTAPRIVFKNGDTRVFERPNGSQYAVSPGFSTTDPERISQIMSIGAGETSKKSIREGILAQHPVAARAGEFVRGAPFIGSYADELVGAIAGPEAATGMRAVSEAVREERPKETLALNLAGGLVGSAPLVAAAPAAFFRAPSFMPAIGNVAGGGTRLAQGLRAGVAGAAAGGVEGTIYGAGEGTTTEERKAAAVQYGGIGALTGGLLGSVTPAVSEGVGNLIGRFRRSDIRTMSRELGISAEAAKVIKNTFDAGGGIDDAVARLRSGGDTAMIADAGEAAQALLDASLASGGKASQMGREAITGRVSQTGTAAREQMEDLLGEAAPGPRTAVAEIQARTGPARQAAYNAALTQPVNYASAAGMKIDEIVGRIPTDTLRAAITEANEEIMARGLPAKQIMASIGDDGAVSIVEKLNAYQLNELKKALDTLAQGAKGDYGLATAASMRYGDLARELRNAMMDALPGYSEALKLGGDTIAERNAFSLGERILSPRLRVEDILLDLGDNPSDAALAAARRGLRTEVERVLGEVKALPSRPDVDAAQALTLMKSFSSDNVRAKIRALLGNQAEPMLQALDEALAAASLQARTSMNSATAARLAQQETVRQITEPGMLGKAAQGDLVGTTKDLVRAVTGQTAEYTAERQQAIYADIVRALTEKRGPSAQRALRVLQDAMSRQSLTDAQTDIVAKAIAAALYGGGTTAITIGIATE